MLTTLLTSLQSVFTSSRGILLTGVLPLVLFGVGCWAAAERISSRWTHMLLSWSLLDAAKMTVSGIVAGLMILALSYLVSASSAGLLEMAEGRSGPFHWFGWLLYPAQYARLARLQKEYDAAGVGEAMIKLYTDPQASEEAGQAHWPAVLDRAAEIGNGTAACRFPCTWMAWVWGWLDQEPAVREMVAVRMRLHSGRSIPADRLQAAVDALAAVLRENATQLETKASKSLYCAGEELKDAMVIARDRFKAQAIRVYNQRQFTFPGDFNQQGAERFKSSAAYRSLAPTTMGNIGRTMTSYTLSRYSMSLDIFWSRLQKNIMSSKDVYGLLQDTKTQVDCTVALFWAAVLYTVLWSVVFGFVAPRVLEFRVVVVLGPIVSWLLYQNACKTYRAFADLVRAAADQFRFALLADLHLALPRDADAENALWEHLGGVAGFNRPSLLTFNHDAKN